MSGLVLGARMALEQYPGYKLICQLRDGEGIEEILAGKLRVLADWLSPQRKLSQGLEQTKKRPDSLVKDTANEIKSLAPQITIRMRTIQRVYPPASESKIEFEKTHNPSKLVGLRYTGDREGEMRTLIKVTGKWIEFSALAPDLDLEEEEADWLLAHRRDFVRR